MTQYELIDMLVVAFVTFAVLIVCCLFGWVVIGLVVSATEFFGIFGGLGVVVAGFSFTFVMLVMRGRRIRRSRK